MGKKKHQVTLEKPKLNPTPDFDIDFLYKTYFY